MLLSFNREIEPIKDPIMDDIFKDDEFAQFILNKYFVDSNMTDKEKLEYIGSSVEAFRDATECFKASVDIKH